MADLQRRKEKLLDLRLDNNIDRDIYDKKNQELSEQLKKLQAEQLQLVELSKNQESTKTRIKEFRKNLNSGELNVGTEKNKVRPVLVLSNNKINNSEKVVVVCITDAKGKVNARCLPIQDSWFLLYSDTKDEEK